MLLFNSGYSILITSLITYKLINLYNNERN